MPHKQPQICDDGCCDETEVECCLLAKSSFSGTYSSLGYTGGPAAIGPMDAFTDGLNDCLFGSAPSFSQYTFPGVANFSKTIDFTGPGCSDGVTSYICQTTEGTDPSGYLLCAGACVSGSSTRFDAIALGWIDDDVSCTQSYYNYRDRPHYRAQISVEWYCDLSGAYHFRLMIFCTFVINEWTRSLLGLTLPDSCSASRLPTYSPLPADGVDYKWYYTPGAFGSAIWWAERDDGQAAMVFERPGGTLTGGSTSSGTIVTAWAYSDDVATVSLWSDPWDPHNLIVGTATLT